MPNLTGRAGQGPREGIQGGRIRDQEGTRPVREPARVPHSYPEGPLVLSVRVVSSVRAIRSG